MILLSSAEIIFPQIDTAFFKGADVSFIPQIEDLGGAYFLDSVQVDPLEIFKQNDFNYIRLRLWHSPEDGYCGLAKTIEMAERIKNKGLKFLLDLHYSDTWADPTVQEKPAAWDTLSYVELIDSVYSYTYNAVRTFDSMNVLPDMIQIGNEISHGFLWPDGKVEDSFDNQQWIQFTTLLNSGINAVKDASPDSDIPVMIHTDQGADNNECRIFFGNLISFQVPFDIIGLSYYPWWQGTIAGLEQNVNDLAVRFNKDIIVAETAYPWTLDKADSIKNFVDSTSELDARYPPTVEGQDSFLTKLIEITRNIPNGKGRGIFYWGSEYISVAPLYSSWENLTLFNFQGEVLNSIKVFNNPKIDSIEAISVTFNLNTSTHFDTISSSSYVQLRGEAANGSDTLASGENISWSDSSGIIFKNINGDYWQTTLKVLPGTELNYKYWTGHDSTNPTFLRLGWEGPILSYDSAGSDRKFIAGNRDTILSMEYFNSSGDTLHQYRQPFEHKTDSIAVRFKVNMGGAVSAGRFDPEVNGPVGVRGDPLDTINILSWDQTKIILTRDSLSVNNGSFWSGTAYYPLYAAGAVQSYKFFIENDNGNGLENNIPERTFTIPFKDTTIAWVYFDNQNIITNVEKKNLPLSDFLLYQNYPNPFNPSTKINFELKDRVRINLTVFNYLGEKVVTLEDTEKEPGKHFIEWNGKDSEGINVSSGIYFIRLAAGSKMKTIKAILLK
ncbi:MAG: glycosyl hydrolase 53 family protein [Ignavibacteria bacterium]